ncbi:FHA domain-containing protein [Paenibacillus donghaensis]|uniref:FHA domain-containing protein n=1 Tax=Paenibacillus donghaensis TaxID=414771 RepID=A0A2Z2KP24_9BACL|nr:FHA domain-containing protein [Paenibacillus donghaensis]ASA23012.1 hypothetical protein B9T62_20705 [Paenibacillus donghaensis]
MMPLIRIIVNTAGQPTDGSFAYVQGAERLIIGRYTGASQVDLAINNLLVSKQHCSIQRVQDKLYVEDLGSKNGTELNGLHLTPHIPHLLNVGDILTLVDGRIELQVQQGLQLEDTRELNVRDWDMRELERQQLNMRELDLQKSCRGEELRLNDHLQRVELDGNHISLSKKEYQLFRLLYGCLDHFVTREQIVQEVWQERFDVDSGLIGIDEVNSLIYRTNRKLNGYFTIKSVYKQGIYMQRYDDGVIKA